MGISDRDYMKRPVPDYDPEEERLTRSRTKDDGRAAKLEKRITVVFGCIVVAVILITSIALVLSK